MQANPQPYGGHGGRNHRPREDESFLSQEEKECLQFFEKTIDSIEGVEEKPVGRPSQSHTKALVSSLLASRNSKDQEIIDLVRPETDFNPTSPDFRHMLQAPESHFDMKPRRVSEDSSLPSEYNPPLPSGSYGPSDHTHSPYHPPGCVPTPVLIAQQIAENQDGVTPNINPSGLLRRSSSGSDRPGSYSADSTLRMGPPTSARPSSRYPANISMSHGGKEPLPNLGNVHINERRSQMLSNLVGTSHPFLQEESSEELEEKPRNVGRSISFKDPNPDRSRNEALSKLGLYRDRAMSGDVAMLSLPTSTPTPLERSTSAEIRAKSPESTLSAVPNPSPTTTTTTIITESSTKLPEPIVATPRQSQIHVERKAEIPRRDSVVSQEERFPDPPPPAFTISSSHHHHHHNPPHFEYTAPPISPPPEVTSLESNIYGGKSINMHPTTRSEPAVSPSSPEPKGLPPAMANPSEFNNYGGKTKIMNPTTHPAMSRNDLPDILSSHIKSQTLPAKSEAAFPPELNSYGGKSRTFNPSNVVNHRHSDGPVKSPHKAPAPAPAPKPARQSYHGGGNTTNTTQKSLQRPPSPEHKRRSNSMFRPQGITVQFSGRGKTDESRRDALRKLGLWKDS